MASEVQVMMKSLCVSETGLEKGHFLDVGSWGLQQMVWTSIELFLEQIKQIKDLWKCRYRTSLTITAQKQTGTPITFHSDFQCILFANSWF